MSWPTPKDYNEAFQNPQDCFDIPEIKHGSILLDKHGLPKAAGGGFASVYKLSYKNKTYAIRCFLKDIKDNETRYEAITNYLKKIQLPYTANCDFIREGIKVTGKWYPILKMDWIEGFPLGKYIDTNVNNAQELTNLANNFINMFEKLQTHSIAHGDLQHDNIMMVNKEIRLIDYDGMYVPKLKGLKSQTVGVPGYQHPKRTGNDFNEYLDNFSSWVIYLSILGLRNKPELWNQLKCRDNEKLLFSKEDLENIARSTVLQTLLQIKDPILNELCVEFQRLCIDSQNSLTFTLENFPSITKVLSRISKFTSKSTTISKLPSWIHDHLDIKKPSEPEQLPKKHIEITPIIQIVQIEHLLRISKPLFEDPNFTNSFSELSKLILSCSENLNKQLTSSGLKQDCWLETATLSIPAWINAKFKFKPMLEWKLRATKPISFPNTSLIPIKIDTNLEKLTFCVLLASIITSSYTSIFTGLIITLVEVPLFFVLCFYQFSHSKQFLELKELTNKLKVMEKELEKEKQNIAQETVNLKQKFSFLYETSFSFFKKRFNDLLEIGKKDLDQIIQNKQTELKKLADDDSRVKQEIEKEFIKLCKEVIDRLKELKKLIETFDIKKQKKLEELEKSLQSDLLTFENKIKEIDDLEKKEIERETQILSANLSLLESIRKELDQKNQLRKFQAIEEEKSILLERHKIESFFANKIPDDLKKQLNLKKIYSAADIKDIQYYSGVTHIKTSSQKYVRIEGLSGKQAFALLEWKKNLESEHNNDFENKIQARMKLLYDVENNKIIEEKRQIQNKHLTKLKNIEEHFEQQRKDFFLLQNSRKNQYTEEAKNIEQKYRIGQNTTMLEAKKLLKKFEKDQGIFIQKYQQLLNSIVELWSNTSNSSSKEYLDTINKYYRETINLQKEIEKMEIDLTNQQSQIEQEIENKENYIHNKTVEIEELKYNLHSYENIKFSKHIKKVLLFKN